MIEDIKMLIKRVKGNPRLLLLGDAPQPSHHVGPRGYANARRGRSHGRGLR
jgi:hypothetical protein